MTKRSDARINPYIATTDVMISVVLVFVLMLVSTTVVSAARSVMGEANDRVQRRLHEVQTAVLAMPAELRPELDEGRNDPIGTQRWRFTGARFFEPESTVLTAEGRAAFETFGLVLARIDSWRRIRVEGHTATPRSDGSDDWEGSALLSSAVVRAFVEVHGLEPWFFAVAGRGGQDPESMIDRRVDIIIEFCSGERCKRDLDVAGPN